MTGTYDSKYPNGDKSYGGYANYWRGPSHFVLKIPDSIPSEDAAPMLCGGITVFSPLTKNGCGPGKWVGIVGVGGLGHFGLLYAKVRRRLPSVPSPVSSSDIEQALGADEVVAVSRTSTKKADAQKMGADRFSRSSFLSIVYPLLSVSKGLTG
jgi:alcohol dehydrogenase (NADP+)